MLEYHPEPKGCQWFKSCEECGNKNGWCLIPNNENPLPHNSMRAYRLRVRRAKRLAAQGKRLREIAEYFKIAEPEVEEWLKDANVRQTIEEIRRYVREEREAGAHEKELVEKYGVTKQTIWRACMGIPKRRRASGNSMTPRRAQHRDYELPEYLHDALSEAEQSAEYRNGVLSRAIKLLTTLTAPERRTFYLMGLNRSSDEIAEELGISIDALQHRVGAIKDKLRLYDFNRDDMLALAILLKVIPAEKAFDEIGSRKREYDKLVKRQERDRSLLLGDEIALLKEKVIQDHYAQIKMLMVANKPD